MFDKIPKAKLKKVGTVQTVNVDTGEVTSERQNAFTMLPTAPGACSECGVDHPFDRPHNRDSLAYRMSFYATHGRYPTWSDAMAHCTPEVQSRVREVLSRSCARTA